MAVKSYDSNRVLSRLKAPLEKFWLIASRWFATQSQESISYCFSGKTLQLRTVLMDVILTCVTTETEKAGGQAPKVQ